MPREPVKVARAGGRQDEAALPARRWQGTPGCGQPGPFAMNAAAFSLWWQQVLLVMAGGALGAVARHAIGGLLLRHVGTGFPWGTLVVNLVGSFAAGFIAVWLEGRGQSALYWRAFLIVGVLGALTTYSALMLECLLFARSDRSSLMLGYLALTLVAGLMLVWAGARLAAMLRVTG